MATVQWSDVGGAMIWVRVEKFTLSYTDWGGETQAVCPRKGDGGMMKGKGALRPRTQAMMIIRATSYPQSDVHPSYTLCYLIGVCDL